MHTCTNAAAYTHMHAHRLFHNHANIADTHNVPSDVRPLNTPSGSAVIGFLMIALLKHTRDKSVVQLLPHACVQSMVTLSLYGMCPRAQPCCKPREYACAHCMYSTVTAAHHTSDDGKHTMGLTGVPICVYPSFSCVYFGVVCLL